MGQSKSRVKDLVTGDLVSHLLYGKEWIGIIISFKEDSIVDRGLHNEKALVQIQPGTAYEGFFKNKVTSKNMITPDLGYVSTNWLFRLELVNKT